MRFEHVQRAGLYEHVQEWAKANSCPQGESRWCYNGVTAMRGGFKGIDHGGSVSLAGLRSPLFYFCDGLVVVAVVVGVEGNGTGRCRSEREVLLDVEVYNMLVQGRQDSTLRNPRAQMIAAVSTISTA